jgi:hypothetical protein
MKLLPTQQTERQKSFLRKFLDEGKIDLCEPCDCGNMVRHNNGGNYHALTQFRMEGGKVYRNATNTSDYAPEDDWREVTFSAAIDEIAQLASEGCH